MNTTVDCFIHANTDVESAYQSIKDHVVQKHEEIINIIGINCFYGRIACFLHSMMNRPSSYPKKTLKLCEKEIKIWFDAYFDIWRKEIHQLEMGRFQAYRHGKIVGAVTFYKQRKGTHKDYSHWNYVARSVNNIVDRNLGGPGLWKVLERAKQRTKTFILCVLWKITKLPTELIREILGFIGFNKGHEWLKTETAGQISRLPNTVKRRRLEDS